MCKAGPGLSEVCKNKFVQRAIMLRWFVCQKISMLEQNTCCKHLLSDLHVCACSKCETYPKLGMHKKSNGCINLRSDAMYLLEARAEDKTCW